MQKKNHRIGYGSYGPVCVQTAKGKHVRVDRDNAAKLVSEGGRYLAKWEYQGTIKKDGKDVQPDWTSKKAK